MTAVEWATCIDPLPMLAAMHGSASERQWWLFAVACFRRVEAEPEAEPLREMIGLYEMYADGRVPPAELLPFTSCVEGSRRAQSAVGYGQSINPALAVKERIAQAHLARDIFGRSFRRVAFDPSWRTEAVVALAAGMYESQDFGAMPMLADALDDGGCCDVDLLAHCRGDGPHARGCWVVDLVLGKE